MWYKNLRIYQITRDIEVNDTELQAALLSRAFAPCNKHQAESAGWISPLVDNLTFDEEAIPELLFEKQGTNIGFKLRIQEKVLPASVVREVVEERAHSREIAEGRKIFLREKRQLKDEIIAEMLPRAFHRSSHIKGFWDLQRNMLLIDASSASKAEKFLRILRESLGSLPVIPLECKVSPAATMTSWIQTGLDNNQLFVADECELRATDEEAALVRLKRQDLSAEEVQAHLNAGKQVIKLRLNWRNAIEATLTEEGTLQRLKFSDSIKELDGSYTKEEALQRHAHEFAVMVTEITAYIDTIISALGGLTKTDWNEATE